MGKKRSKTSKQKQKKAAQGKNKFGVSMTKGGGRERLATSSILLDPNNNNAPNKSMKHKRFLQGGKPKQGQTPRQGKGKRKNNEEQEAFRQEMQSLQERHSVSQLKKSEARSVKKKMLLHNMNAATLVIDDRKKSTKRLMNETTAEVGKLSGIGTAVNPNNQFFPSNQLQILAQQHREAWSEEQPSELLGSDNPYSALHNDSEEEEEQNLKPTEPPVQLFQFAPPSFAISNDYIDPDL